MENVVLRDTETASKSTQLEEEWRPYSWLKDYLERLEGEEAYREFQERCYDDPEYYALIASLAA